MPRKLPNIETSRALLARSDEIIIGGCQGHKRSHQMLDRGYPVFARRASGARFWDVDGNEYLDYLMGFGPILLGYDDPVLNEAIRRQMAEGTIYTLAHPKELEVAEALIEAIPGAEMLGFFSGGSAAVSGAVRLARAYTGRDAVVRCGYHGWHDWARPGDPGVPAAVSALTTEFPYGDLEALEDRLKAREGQVACVVVETVQGDGPPEGFLQGCVDVAHRHGALCVFDEIKVGFRVALGGAAEHYGVTADLSVYGKACCNGYPGSFVAGRREILATEPCRSAWLAATFHCDLPSLVALETVMSEVKRRDGIAHQWRLGERLIEGVNRVCEAGGLGYRLTGLGPMPVPRMAEDDRDRCLGMLRGCLARGFYLHPGHPMFLSLAHTEADIDRTIEAVGEAVAEVG